jgi:hypothetical protein
MEAGSKLRVLSRTNANEEAEGIIVFRGSMISLEST